MVLRSFTIIGVGLFVAALFVLALFIADHIANDEAVRGLVEQYGYIGILVASFIAGFNLVVPVPAAVFAPIFIAAGYPLWLITILIVIGTTLADFLGYAIGYAGRDYVEAKWPKIVALLTNIIEKHRKWLVPFVFFYAMLSPIPNEAILIPLALLGVRLRTVILPFVLGGLIHHGILVYGAQGIFETFF